VDATIYDGADLSPREIRMEARAERIAVKQEGNVVEANLPWVDQPGIRIKYDLKEPTVMERLKDKRKQEAMVDNTAFGEGGVKFDIILNEKPDTNTFCYTVEGAENYIFTYQPALTPKEIADGMQRPENIIGSYAVYHNSLKNNQYKTGKAFHIERPQVWSLSNDTDKKLAQLTYENGKLCVIAPQSFLDTADYPVRIDPTLGYTSVGASRGDPGAGADYAIIMPLTTSVDMSDITSVSWYASSSVAVNSSAAIYTASSTSFNPYTVSSSTQGTISNPTGSWNTYNFDGTFAYATTSNSLFSVLVVDQAKAEIYYDNVSVGSYYTTGTIWSQPPPSINNMNVNAKGYIFSGYITYTEVGGQCDATVSLCPARWVNKPSISTTRGSSIPGATITTLGNTSALVIYPVPYLGATVGGIQIAQTTDSFNTLPISGRLDSTNYNDTISHALWDSAWTKASTTRNVHISTLDTGVDDTYYTVYNATNNTLVNSMTLGTTQSASAVINVNTTAITMAENGSVFMASADASDSWVVTCNGTSTCTTASNWYQKGGDFDAFRSLGDDIPLLSPLGGTNGVILIYYDKSASSLNYNIWSATSSSWQTATNTIATAIDNSAGLLPQSIALGYASTTGTTYLVSLDDANDTTTQDHDIRMWKFSSTTGGWVALTNPVTNATGFLLGVTMTYTPINNRLWVMYGRETTTAVATGQLYYKYSDDGGSTWTSETLLDTINETVDYLSSAPVSNDAVFAMYRKPSGFAVKKLWQASSTAPMSTPALPDDTYFLE
jgi:hypothetical protein